MGAAKLEQLAQMGAAKLEQLARTFDS